MGDSARLCQRVCALGAEMCTMRVPLKGFAGKARATGSKGATVHHPNTHCLSLSFPIRALAGWFLTERTCQCEWVGN